MLLSEDLTLVAVLAGLREHSGVRQTQKWEFSQSEPETGFSAASWKNSHSAHQASGTDGPVVGMSAPEIQLQSAHIPCGPSKIRWYHAHTWAFGYVTTQSWSWHQLGKTVPHLNVVLWRKCWCFPSAGKWGPVEKFGMLLLVRLKHLDVFFVLFCQVQS